MEKQLSLNHLPPVFIPESYYQKSKKSKINVVHSVDKNTVGSSSPVKSQLILIPTIVVHPHQINYYNQVVWHPKKNKTSYDQNSEISEFRRHAHLLDSKRTPAGNVSKIAKRKITKAIDYLLLFASDKKVTAIKSGRKFNFKIAFITLTLPSQQIHSDNEIKRKCLNSFLIELSKYENVHNYIWRAEKQKNGSIHFHIIIDKFVHWNDIRNRWNRIVNKLGYVDRYRASMKEFYKDGFKVRNELIKNWSEVKQRASYKRNLETGYHSPNSTDVHSIKQIHNLTHYFIKYLTKNENNPKDQTSKEEEKHKQTGRIWGASRNLQNIKGASIILDSELQTELETIIAETNCKAYTSDYFSIFYIDFQKLNSSGGNTIFQRFAEYLVNEFDYNYQTDLSGKLGV